MSESGDPRSGGPVEPAGQGTPVPAQPPEQVYAARPIGSPPPAPPAPVNPGQYPPGAYASQPTNGMAIASLVLGILWLGWVGSVLAVIFGHLALGQIRQSGGAQGGRGLAIAGLVLGWIGIGSLVVFVLLPLIATALLGGAAAL